MTLKALVTICLGLLYLGTTNGLAQETGTAAESLLAVDSASLENSTNLVQVTGQPASLGLPSRHRIQLGLVSGYGWKEDYVTSRFSISDDVLINLPQFGGVRLSGELGLQKGRQSPGVTTTIYGTLFGIKNGLEYNTRLEDLFYRMAVNIVTRRGGLTGKGDRLRIEWVPAMQLVQVGLIINPPWSKYRRNRPLRNHVRMNPTELPMIPRTDSVLVSERLLTRLQHSIAWLDKMLTPRLGYDVDSPRNLKKFNQSAGDLNRHFSETGHDFAAEDSIYHQTLSRAFTQAFVGNESLGHQAAIQAELIILNEIVLPVNRLFGQKKEPFDLSRFLARAQEKFAEEIDSIAGTIPVPQLHAAEIVFRHVTETIAKVADASKERWNDERLVWLPLNYGLRPSQYDSQREMDRVIEEVTDSRFSDANDIEYLINDQAYLEFESSVLETRFYHVLHIHDFPAETANGPDEIAWRFVVEGYIQAFINAIRELDAGHRSVLPQFMIFHDQHYYEDRRSSRIHSFLQNLTRDDGVSIGNRSLEEYVNSRHQELLATIANSPKLQARSEDFIASRIRVNVSVTNAFDPTFTEDALARDHRKIAFRDVFENSPSDGMAIFSGMGVGANYVGPRWDDRSIKVRGPALLSLKDATRGLFLSQGFDSTEIPFYLQKRDLPNDYESMCENLRARGWQSCVVDVMNETGFGSKRATIVKAVLYNLLPEGTVMLIPDSIWAGDYWASMLFATALRGCRVYAIAPANDNSPSNAPVTLESIRKSLKAMMRLSKLFENELTRTGGDLRVGLYRREHDVQNVARKIETFIESIEANGEVRQEFGIDQELLEKLRNIRESIATRFPDSIKHLSRQDSHSAPKLHFKSQLFVSPTAINQFGTEEWKKIGRNYFSIRSQQVCSDTVLRTGIKPGLFDSLMPPQRATNSGVDVADSSGILYMAIGSHNQDRRSMLLDGEALVLISGTGALIGAVDFGLLAGEADWLEDETEVDEEFPRAQGLMRSLVRLIKNWI